MQHKRNSRSRFGWAAFLAVLMTSAAPEAIAQVERNIPTEPYAVDEAYLSGLNWRNIGPNRGGRSIAAAGSTARPMEYYFAAVGGGLWKTTDGGTTWNPVTDGQIGTSAVGGVAVCEANPDVVYLTTGETQLRGNILPGDGVYKSIDAGKTWKHIGLREVQNFSRVRIHPTDCNTVFVGGFGHYGAPNPERGVYQSKDGGTTWRKVLYRDPRSGAVDISIDPKNPNVVYAALWEAWRKPWAMSSGGPGSGLFKSIDGGNSWTELTRNPGMPQGVIGKIGVSVSPVDGNRVYAIVEHKEGGVFVSDDAGATWRRTNDSRDLRQRAFYYTRLVADPKIKDRVYVLNVQFFRSDDGGKTFPKKIKVPHGDNHDLWIAANDSDRMIQANDGGGNVSVNGGTSWTEQDYPTAQIYRLGISHHFPWFACGGQQDNSTICVPGKDWKHVNVLGGQYGFAAGGGESGYVTNDPRNPNIFYSGSYGGSLDRFDYSTGQSRRINVWPENPMGQSAGDLTERFQWTFPIVFDPQDPTTLYVTSQHVWRSTNQGQSWQRISPDLTRHERSTLGPSGGPITLDQTGVETYATVFALAPSRLERDVIWAGSDDGLVHISRDNGGTWQNITPRGLPKFVKITTIEDSPHRAGTAYMTGHRFLLNDFQPYIFKTSDYGKSWTRVANGIPADEIARSIREDIVRPGLLYLGTERGVWISFDDGRRWQKLQRNLPAVQVSDLAVTDHDLVIATHGRSFWVLDKIDVLRQIDAQGGTTRNVQLFKPAPAVRGIDQGLIIDYFLPADAQKLTIDVLDPAGKLIRSFTGSNAEPKKSDDDDEEGGSAAHAVPKMKAGLNRFTWDMRYPGYTEFPGMVMWAARNRGPVVIPGQYQAQLTVDGVKQTQPFEIRIDPRVQNVASADLERRLELASQIRERVTQANEAVLLIRGIKQQIEGIRKQTTNARILRDAGRLEERLSAIEGRIYQVRNQSRQDPLNYPIMLNNKLAGLMGVVESAEAAPTEQSVAVFNRLSQQLGDQLAQLSGVLDRDLDRFNQRLRQANLPVVERRPLQIPPESTAETKEPKKEATE